MYKDPNKLEGEDLAKYWASILERRMPETYEIERLVTVMKGFYFRSLEHEHETQPEHFSLDSAFSQQAFINFHDEKRPYGNKDVAASIAFNLGWDYKRQLCYHEMPDNIKFICNDLHVKVLAEIKSEMF